MMKRLIIVGGGFAGSIIAKKIENKNFEVILIDNKDYFEFTPGILKAFVNPRHINKIKIEHKRYLKKTRIIVGEVKKIYQTKLLLEDYSNNKTRSILNFDYLVICSGLRYESQIEGSVEISKISQLNKNFNNLLNSKRILIIGGGLVGVELALEIKDYFPEKDISIIHSKNKILNRQHQKIIDFITSFLIKNKIKIHYNQKILKKEDNYYISSSQKKFKADIVFNCASTKKNHEFILENLNNYLDDKNQLKVNSHLQLFSGNDSLKNIFAAGDITNVDEEKSAQSSEKQANTIIKNIFRFEKNKSLINYKPKQRIMVISLGKSTGIICFKKYYLSGKFALFLKRLIEFKEMIKHRKFM